MAGEILAVIEAMKMENILRAERDGTIKTIKAKPGDSVAVDGDHGVQVPPPCEGGWEGSGERCIGANACT